MTASATSPAALEALALRVDQEPSFWNEWIAPRSEVSRAIQFPIDKPEWPNRVVNAYQRDTRRAKASEATPHPAEETR